MKTLRMVYPIDDGSGIPLIQEVDYVDAILFGLVFDNESAECKIGINILCKKDGKRVTTTLVFVGDPDKYTMNDLSEMFFGGLYCFMEQWNAPSKYGDMIDINWCFNVKGEESAWQISIPQ